MPRHKIKPPVESRADLMGQVEEVMLRKFRANAAPSIQYLLNFFTSADLVGIRDDLRKDDQ